MLVCEVGKFAVEQGLTAGVYYFLQEIAPGIVLPYIGQTGNLATRIARHVRDKRLFEPVLEFVEVAGGQEARSGAPDFSKMILLFQYGTGWGTRPA